MADRRMGFDDFVVARGPDLGRLAFALTGDAHGAQDLVQRALTQTWLRWNSIRHNDPYVYARRVLVNDVARARQRQRALVIPTDAVPDLAVAGHIAEQASDADLLLRALLTLPPRTRAVVVLRYREDLSEKQAAEALGMSLGSVKSHGSRGLTALRAVLHSHSAPAGSKEQP